MSALSAPVFVSAVPAFSAPTAADMETARTLFTEGKALRDKGDLPGALDRFRAAHALGRTPITGVELGRTLVLMGRLTEAREVLLEVSHIVVDPNESPARLAARKDASDLVESIRPRIPSLVITFSDLPPGTPTPAVIIDGVSVPSAATSLPRKVDPGPHEVTATLASGPQRTLKIMAKEGETVPVAFAFGDDAKLPAPLPVAATPPVTGEAAPAPAPAAQAGVPALTWVGISLAGAGVIAGAVTGGIVLSEANSIKSAQNCDGRKVCGDSTINTAKTLSTVSDVSFGVAGAGAILAAVSFFTRGQPAPASASAHVEPWVGLGTAGLKGAF